MTTTRRVPQKVLVVAGTRPEGIKLAPVVLALGASPAFDVVLCSTGQHRELLGQALQLFDVEPDIDLAVMRPDQSLNGLTARVIDGLDQTIAACRPDWVIVQGDTTTAFSAALVAFQRRVRVAHVEAGLRSGCRTDPFPEEANRRMTACLATLHLAPTERARANLVAEGIRPEQIEVTGNTVVDAVQHVAAQGRRSSVTMPKVPVGVRRVLLTVHRRENHGEGLRSIVAAVRHLESTRRGKVEFVLPVHPSPRVRGVVEDALGQLDGVTLTQPLPYDALVDVMKSSAFVMTDSGGLQEEAPGLGRPVLVLRQTTERPEGIEAGVARLVGSETRAIIDAAEELLDNQAAYDSMAQAVNPYGDGRAAKRVVDALVRSGVVA